jgi:uncharacterized protein
VNDNVRRLTIESQGASLEAILQTPAATQRGIVVVCHPHPLYGGSMHNNVVDALCDAALQEGLAALRFNFRGVGASSGTHTGGTGEEDDAVAAVEFASQQLAAASAPLVGIAGYSFGARVIASALSRLIGSVQAVVLVSPPTSNLALALLGDDVAKGPYGQSTAQPGPALLLITGDNDNVCPAADLELLAERLRPRPEFAVLEGANHSWLAHESELRDTAGTFLRWNLTSH